MFTGIIEEIGTVEGLNQSGDICRLTIRAPKVLQDAVLGDSIAVNGICLTVTSMTKDTFQADVMGETIRRTSLSEVKRGGHVNLERAMQLGGRFGGHIVSGHVDGTGTILSVKKEGNAIWYQIGAAPEILRYIIEKGSITIDGISLTVAKLDASSFSVSIIPHTRKETILGEKKPGNKVNLENDLIGKYVERLLTTPQEETKPSGISMDLLRENGFL
jgi:riboflavin synthase